MNASSSQPTKLTLAHRASGANYKRMSIRPSATFDTRKAGKRRLAPDDIVALRAIKATKTEAESKTR